MNKRIQLLSLFFITLFLFSCGDDFDDKIITPQTESETVTDADGNIYNTIKIGDQTWMLENLKTTKFNDGETITEYTFDTHGSNWHNAGSEEALYQWALTDDLNNVYTEALPYDYYGAMYNHYAIESGKLAPTGWRIPTQQDFITLENHIAINGVSGNEATALKTTFGWLSSSGNGTNLFGFNGLPNGYVNAFGGSTASEIICAWATINVNTISNTRTSVNLFDENTILYAEDAIQIGHGIRCIKE
jgi:uncharacterized protein (TIGR02145 family)